MLELKYNRPEQKQASQPETTNFHREETWLTMKGKMPSA